jgi:hypothetical protein
MDVKVKAIVIVIDVNRLWMVANHVLLSTIDACRAQRPKRVEDENADDRMEVP